MAGRKLLTKDMLIAALDKGWSVSLTAAHYGMHRKSIDAACERFGIMLPMHKFSPQVVSRRSPEWKEVVNAATLKPKGRPVWSASPEAVEKALAKMKEKNNV
jgi:hypothetical protein